MIEEDLIAERIAIESYREIVAYRGFDNAPHAGRNTRQRGRTC
jgi:hypothetical protein